MTRTWRHRRRQARNFLVGLLGPSLLRAWVGSLRIRWTGPGLVNPSPEGRENVIYVFWHQRIFLFPVTHRGQGLRPLISAHGDGEMLARVMQRLGFHVVRGSSKRGGSNALRELLAEVGSGFDFAITPDGPQGPRCVFQSGAAFFASRSGVKVVPLSVAYRRSWSLRSWDRFIIPRPFTRGVVQMGPHLRVPPGLRGEALEEWRRRLEETVQAITEDTERRFDELYRQGISTRAFLEI